MPRHVARRHVRPWVAFAMLVVAAGCSTDATEPHAAGTAEEAAAAAPTGDLAAIEHGIVDWGETAGEVFFFAEDPMSDPDIAMDFLDRGAAAARELHDALPTDPELEGDDRSRYDAVLAALVAWEEDALAARDEVEERHDELAAALEAWDGESRPPQGYLDLMLRNDAGAEGFAEACAEFAAPLDISPDCFSFRGDVPPPGEGPPDE